MALVFPQGVAPPGLIELSRSALYRRPSVLPRFRGGEGKLLADSSTGTTPAIPGAGRSQCTAAGLPGENGGYRPHRLLLNIPIPTVDEPTIFTNKVQKYKNVKMQKRN